VNEGVGVHGPRGVSGRSHGRAAVA
jgi:hypothetical protein